MFFCQPLVPINPALEKNQGVKIFVRGKQTCTYISSINQKLAFLFHVYYYLRHNVIKLVN